MSVKFKRFNYSLSSNIAINCNLDFQENITNKGLFLKEIVEEYYPDSYFSSMVPCNGYYISVPLLDKISVLGNPPLNKEEKVQLNGKLFQESKFTKEEEDVDWLVKEVKDDPYKTRYKDHYRIDHREHDVGFNFYFTPLDEKNRFLKIEFSPWKCGKDGVQLIKQWYQEAIVHQSFEQLINAEHAIKRFDVAIDIIGLKPSDMILNFHDNHMSQRWHSKEGQLETYYPLRETKDGKSKISNICMYFKSQNILDNYAVPETDEYSYKKANLLESHFYYPLLAKKIPITRIEKRIKPSKDKKQGKNFQELAFESKNPFGSVKVPYSKYRLVNYIGDPNKADLENKTYAMFLEAVRNSGKKSAKEKLPKMFEEEFKKDLHLQTINLFEIFEDSDNWKDMWAETMMDSGLV